MEPESSLRHNQDLIESLNEVYKNTVNFNKELVAMRGEIERMEEEMREKLLNMGKLMVEVKNSLNQRMRHYQGDQVRITRGLNDLDYFKNELETIKNTNRTLKERVKKLEDDMIVFQSHIIKDKINPSTSSSNSNHPNNPNNPNNPFAQSLFNRKMAGLKTSERLPLNTERESLFVTNAKDDDPFDPEFDITTSFQKEIRTFKPSKKVTTIRINPPTPEEEPEIDPLQEKLARILNPSTTPQ